MKNFTLKSLLLILAIVGGVNAAWADNVLYERGGETAWSEKDIADGEWSNGTIDGGIVLSYNNSGITSSRLLTSTENSIVTLTSSFTAGGANGRNGSYDYLKIGGVTLKSYGQDNKTEIDIDGVVTDLKLNGRGTTYSVKVIIDQASGSVTYDINGKTGEGNSSVGVSSVEIGHLRYGREGYAASLKLNSIQITEKVQIVETANYTIRYLFGETVLKDPVTRSTLVGNSIELIETDKEAIYSSDNSIKYVYDSDDAEGKVVAADGSTVVTVYFKEAAKYAYTLNGVDADGNVLKELATGEAYEGESVRVYYTKAIEKDGKWYVIDKNAAYPYYGIDIKEEGTKTLTYTETTDFDFFIEGDELNKTRSWAAPTGTPDRVSNGNASRMYAKSYYYTQILDPGVYTLTINGRNQRNADGEKVYLYLRDAEGNNVALEDVETPTWTKMELGEKVIENITVPAGYAIALHPGEYNGNIEIDYLMLKKTAAETIPVTVTTAGYATLCSEVALDFSAVEGLKAYVAEVNDMTVNFKEVQQAPANTGLLLKGEGEFEVPVIASADAVETNYLVGVMEETPIEVANNYVLMNGDSGVGFYKVSDAGFTVRAGSAYLSLPAISAKMFIGFDGDTATAIQGVDAAKADKDAPAYNLAGQRVSGQYKGIVVRGGHKIVIK